MPNNSNEWENEDTEQQYSDEYESEDESEFEEGSENDTEEYEDDEDYDDEYVDEDDEEESDEDNGFKRKLLVGGFTLLILLILIGGGLLGTKLMKKTAENNMANVSTVEDVQDINADENLTEKSETVIDENGEELTVIDIENEEAPESEEAKKPVLPSDETEKIAEKDTEKTAEKTDNSSLEIEDAPQPAKMSKDDDDTVDIAIGDVGRKNPFLPQGSKIAAESSVVSSAGFEVIEPPALSPERSDIAKLLGTKVTGILYDEKRPSAIINIDGIDQLVRIGDVLNGFSIINITKTRVVIQSDSNIYKASVGQPLNAEKVVNSAEISNLEEKFYGSNNQ